MRYSTLKRMAFPLIDWNVVKLLSVDAATVLNYKAGFYLNSVFGKIEQIYTRLG